MSVVYSLVTRNSKRIAVLELKNGAVNGLSLAMRQGIVEQARKAQKEKVDAIIIMGSGQTFPAGADIAEFESGAWKNQPDLNDVVNELDAISAKTPIIAAIHGTAFGGGLELAMAANYRVAATNAKMALPEVHLGILPGAQGTQRLPRLAGGDVALDMILSGAPITATRGQEIKLVDKVAGKDGKEVKEAAIDFAANTKYPLILPRISQMKPGIPVDETLAAAQVKKYQQRGHIAHPKILEAVRAGCSRELESGVKIEQKLFDGLMATNEAASLQHMFFAERNCGKVPNVDPKTARDVKRVGIIGSGTMGCGIAMAFINKGIPVVVVDFEERLANAAAQIRSTYEKSSAYKSGKLTSEMVDKTMNLLTFSGEVTSYGSLEKCDMIVEAAFESLKVKQDIFRKIDKVAPPGALLCTNTSYLSVDAIASATSRPEWVMGAHFFSPANVMLLLENVRGQKTCNEAIATAMKVGKTIGKITVLAGNKFGFIGNRMFEPYTQQAICMLEEGLTPSQVDAPLGPSGFGMAMGPLSVLDLAGNDIGMRIRMEDYFPHKGANVKGARGKTWIELADGLCAKERYGQKTGFGWYKYGAGKRVGEEDAIVHDLLKQHMKKHGLPARSIKPEEVVERCVLSMVNEGFRILEEGVAVRSSDIDVVWAYGYGFPRFKGGPMFYADHHVGLKHVHAKLIKHMKAQPELPKWHFEPAPLLEKLVTQGKSLKQYEKSLGL